MERVGQVKWIPQIYGILGSNLENELAHLEDPATMFVLRNRHMSLHILYRFWDYYIVVSDSFSLPGAGES